MKLGSDEIPPVLTWDQGVFSRPSGGVSVYIHDAKSGVIFLWGWERCCLDLADFHAVLLKLFRFIFWCVGQLETLGFQAGCLYVRPSPDFVYVDILSGRFLRAASCREPTTVSLLHLTHTQIDTSCMNGGKKKNKPAGVNRGVASGLPLRGLPQRAASPALGPAPPGGSGAASPRGSCGREGAGPCPSPCPGSPGPPPGLLPAIGRGPCHSASRACGREGEEAAAEPSRAGRRGEALGAAPALAPCHFPLMARLFLPL